MNIVQEIIPDICHERHEYIRVNFFDGVNFYRFNAKNWQFTVYFAVIKQKLAIFCVFCRKNAKNWQFTVYFVVIYAFFRCKFYPPKILLV